MLLTGIVAFEFRCTTNQFLFEALNLDAYIAHVEPIMLSTVPMTANVHQAIIRFINRLEEIRFTEPVETQRAAVESAALEFEAEDDPERLRILSESAVAIAIRIITSRRKPHLGMRIDNVMNSLVSEEWVDWRHAEGPNSWIMGFSGPEDSPVPTVSEIIGRADVVDANDGVSGELLVRLAKGHLDTLELSWWGREFPRELPHVDTILVAS